MQPDIIQLKNVIANGTNEHDYTLILKLDGSFELTQGTGLDIPYPKYVSRYETFDAKSNYVGIDASNNCHYINRLFEWGLREWENFIKTGRTNNFM